MTIIKQQLSMALNSSNLVTWLFNISMTINQITHRTRTGKQSFVEQGCAICIDAVYRYP
jgi:hypothetical protein